MQSVVDEAQQQKKQKKKEAREVGKIEESEAVYNEKDSEDLKFQIEQRFEDAYNDLGIQVSTILPAYKVDGEYRIHKNAILASSHVFGQHAFKCHSIQLENQPTIPFDRIMSHESFDMFDALIQRSSMNGWLVLDVGYQNVPSFTRIFEWDTVRTVHNDKTLRCQECGGTFFFYAESGPESDYTCHCGKEKTDKKKEDYRIDVQQLRCNGITMDELIDYIMRNDQY